MTFHISLVIAGQHVRLVFGRNGKPVYKQFENKLQFVDYFGLMFVSLEVFLEL